LQRRKTINPHGDINERVKVSWTADWGRLLGSGFDVSIKTEDLNGNDAEYKKHIDGLIEGLIKAILKVIEVIVKFIIELISMFIDWIWAAIRWMMEPVLKPIKAGIRGYFENMKNLLDKMSNEYQFNSFISTNTFNELNNLVILPITIIATIATVIDAVLTLISPFTSIVSGLFNSVANFVVPIILSVFISVASKKGSIKFSILDPVESSINFIKNLNNDYTSTRKSKENEVCSGILIILAILTAIFAGWQFLKDSKWLTWFGVMISCIGVSLAFISTEPLHVFFGLIISVVGWAYAKQAPPSNMNKIGLLISEFTVLISIVLITDKIFIHPK
jgi:hypothetical protein